VLAPLPAILTDENPLRADSHDVVAMRIDKVEITVSEIGNDFPEIPMVTDQNQPLVSHSNRLPPRPCERPDGLGQAGAPHVPEAPRFEIGALERSARAVDGDGSFSGPDHPFKSAGLSG